MHLKQSAGSRIFDVCNLILLFLVGLVTLYPFIFIISMSISSINAVLLQEVVLWPVGFSLESYSLVFSDARILTAYGNTLWRTVVGTSLNVLVTTLAAYPLSRKYYSLRGPIMMFFAFTMFFSGGMVPSYLLVTGLGFYDSLWALVLPSMVSVWNLTIARIFFTANIQQELTDAAKIDGASEMTIYLRIVLPLSKAIIAVLVLYYGVSHWNDFFTPLIYIVDSTKMTLPIYLRRVLITGASIDAAGSPDLYVDSLRNRAVLEQLKYATIIVTMLPIMCTYPFLQKYFVKGVMIGALKG